VLKLTIGRRARRSTIKLLARCNHSIVDKEPHYEKFSPRCCADRSGRYRLWQEGRSQTGCCSGRSSCRRCSGRSSCCPCCRSGCCSGCCSGRRCRQTRRSRQARRSRRRQGQGSCWCCCPRCCRRSQRRNEEVIGLSFPGNEKAGASRLFHCLETRRIVQTSCRQPKPPSWSAIPIQFSLQPSADASALAASSGRLFCWLRCAASTCCKRRVSTCRRKSAA
jgi:hypothetical protein